MEITLSQNGMIRVACMVGKGMTVAEKAMCMVAATRPFTLDKDAGLYWVQLFSSSFGLRLCGNGKLMLPV